MTKQSLGQLCRNHSSVLASGLSDPPLRRCQEACLEACAKGARVIEMACGTGKTRVIRDLVAKQKGQAVKEHVCSCADAFFNLDLGTREQTTD